MNQFNKWIELTKQYQQESFWEQIFPNDSNDPHQSSFFTQQEVHPRCDLYELDQKMVLEAELPGVKKQDIHISLQDSQLHIKGQFKTLNPKTQYYLKERPNMSFEKVVSIPVPIEENNIHYTFENGILSVFLPKKLREKSSHIHIYEHPLEWNEKNEQP